LVQANIMWIILIIKVLVEKITMNKSTFFLITTNSYFKNIINVHMYKKKGIISEGGEVLALWLEGSLMKMSCNRLHSNFMKVNLKYNFV